MYQRYQDAMAMILKIGKPDIFLTFTTNVKWPEIVKNLYPGQRAEDRPDLVSRVFHLYLKDLQDLIMKKAFFGKVKGHVHVI